MDTLGSDTDSVRLVRSALAYLYDPAYLQNHPLVSMLDLGTGSDHVTQAQRMRRVLLECIEALKPEDSDQGHAEAARAYAILTYRYVDGLSMEEIAGKLALSRRQAYREHRKGLEAVASLLQNRMRERGEEVASGRLDAVQTEVSHLRQAVHLELLNLQDILESVFHLLAPLTRQMGVQITASSPDTWPPLVADRVILRQSLINLLSYVLHAVQADLVITASYGDEEIRIQVRESSPSTQLALSSPDSPKPDEVSLAVAKALIEAQGGHLQAGRSEGSGHEWQARIVLPASNPRTIMVVDDNADILALFRRYLAGHEVRVIGVADGEQALQVAAEVQPRLITLDVMMPNQDGWEILQRLKDSPHTQHIPVIVCSVLNEPKLALSMGASDVITKPVSQVELLDVLLRWLGPLRPAA